MKTLDMHIDAGVLHAKTITSLGDVVLGDYAHESRRLIVLVPSWLLFDDSGLGHYVFTKTLGERGIFSISEGVHESVWVFASAAEWLREGHEVTIACFDTPAEVLAAMVLSATGQTAPAAIEEVTRVSPNFAWTPDAEIPVSVFAENVRAAEASS